MAITFSTFFTRAGKIIDVMEAVDTARSTTIATEIEQALDQINPASSDLSNEELTGVFSPIATDLVSYRDNGNNRVASMSDALRRLIVATVASDETQPSESDSDAIEELIRQMKEQVVTIEKSWPRAVVTANSENEGNGLLLFSDIRGDGLVNEYAFIETLSCTVSSVSSGGAFSVDGEKSVDPTEYDWPQGSGSSTTIAMLLPGSSANEIANGDVETLDTLNTAIPSGWIKGNGAAAELVSMTSLEIQSLTFSGAMNSGSFALDVTDENGNIQRTTLIAYNASASTQQSAITALAGFEGVTVAAGTVPTYLYTFNGVRNPAMMAAVDVSFELAEVQRLTKNAGLPTSGNFTLSYNSQVTSNLPWNSTYSQILSALQALSNIGAGNVAGSGGPLDVSPITITFVGDLGFRDAATIVVADVSMPSAQVPSISVSQNGMGMFVEPMTASTSHNYRGARAVQVTGDGASAGTFMLQKLTGLKASTQYGFAVALKFDTSGATGTIQFNLIDGVGGSVISDEENLANTIAINATTVSSSASALHTGFFRTPVNLPSIVYLEAALSVAINNTKVLYLDNFILAETTEMYDGGPHAIGYAGNVALIETDTIDVTISTGIVGRLNLAFNRMLNLARSSMLMPTWPVLTFTSGGVNEIKPGDKITGATSGSVTYVKHVFLTSGSWAAGTAAGRIAIRSAATYLAENINTVAQTNNATVASGTPQTHLDATYLD